MKNHRKIVIFSLGYSLLATAYLIPPHVNYFFWSLRFKALARVLNGIFEFLVFVALSFYGGETSFRIFLVLTFLGPLIGYILIKVWEQGFSEKEKIFFAILFKCWFGILAVYGGSVLVAEPSSLCQETLGKSALSKVVTYPEIGLKPGAYHFFVNSTDQGRNWEQVFWVYHRVQVEIPCQNFQQIDDDTYWFWLGWEFAITHDSGQTWHTWNPEEIWPEWGNSNTDFIQNVYFENQQDGIMEIYLPAALTSVRALITQDGGLHWNEP